MFALYQLELTGGERVSRKVSTFGQGGRDRGVCMNRFGVIEKPGSSG